MRIEIHLPDGGELAVGHDPAAGFFASLRIGRRRYEYDAFAEGYDRARPIHGLLAWLVVHQVFDDDDLDEATLSYADLGDDDEEDRLSSGAALALNVIEALKKAAAE